jgi:hypothetical protein
MNLQQFKSELRLAGIKFDPWGEAMGAFFECAGRMNRRGLDIPGEWNYRPGAGSDGTDKDSYWYSLFARCGNKQLAEIGAYLFRLTNALERAGKSY